MRRLLIIGCGDIAMRVANRIAGRYRIYGLVRSMAAARRLRAAGVVPLIGDLDMPPSLGRVGGLAHIVLHTAPPQPAGPNDRRTASLIKALGQAGSLPYRLVYISTSGVYGDCGGAAVGETSRVNPQTGRATRRLSAEQQLRAWGRRRDVGVSVLRVPGIYALDRLPLARLRAGTPALAPADDVHTNHIHADDLASIVIAALTRSLPGRVYNCADESDLKMGDYFDLIADRLGLPRPPRVPLNQASPSVPATQLSFMRESRRLVNPRAVHELRIRLRYPSVQDALGEMHVSASSDGPTRA